MDIVPTSQPPARSAGKASRRAWVLLCLLKSSHGPSRQQALQMGAGCLERSLPRDQQGFSGTYGLGWSFTGGRGWEVGCSGKSGRQHPPATVLQTAGCLATSGFQVMLRMVDKDGLMS